MANTKISELITWTGNTRGFYIVADNSGLTQTYKVTKETLGIFQPEILLKTNSSNQTIIVGNNLTFDTTDFNLNNTNTVSGVTLKSGGTYELRAMMRLTPSNIVGAEINYQWWNDTNTTYFGVVGGAVTTDAGGYTGTDVNEALAYITVGNTNVLAQLKVTATTSAPVVSSAQSRITVKRIA